MLVLLRGMYKFASNSARSTSDTSNSMIFHDMSHLAKAIGYFNRGVDIPGTMDLL